MKGISTILRRFINTRPSSITAQLTSSSSLAETLILSSAVAAVSYTTLISFDGECLPLFNSTIGPATYPKLSSVHLFNHSRSFFADSSSGPSKIISIESEEQLNDSLRKAQDESLPAIFYFTAAWCAPCKLISPVIGQLSERYPHVATYKIDIDKEALATAVGKLNIHSVYGKQSQMNNAPHFVSQPTVHFFRNGQKASEVVGADVNKLNATMETLYK